MKIAVYGGTFNPPHLGHLTAANAAFTQLGADLLLIIPTGQPPHKPLPEGSPTGAARREMTALAADQLGQGERVQVLDWEEKRAGKSYTSDTLQMLREKYPDDALWLMMGTDMFLSLPTWHRAERILELAGIFAFRRSEKDAQELLDRQKETLQKQYPQAHILTATLPETVEISSSALREKLRQGGGEEYLPPAVYGYILREGLYGTQVDLKHLSLDRLRPIALSFLKHKRIAHVLGTEQTAVRLAEQVGANVEQARVAALLHDCTKKLDKEGQLALCERYGLQDDAGDGTFYKLLHAKTGAAVARDLFGVDDAVYEAIRWHTTGHSNMTPLEKVLYMADYIEPNRSFEGVEELRALCAEDLDKGLLRGLQMTVEDTQKRGNPVHRDTIEAIAWVEELCREKER